MIASSTPPPPVRTRARVAPFLAKRLRALDTELGAAIPRVVKGGDEEAIHDLRVAIRRLRTMLKLARPIYGRFLADAARRALTQVQKATGDLRDEEVLDETLGDLPITEPTFVLWRARRRARERRLRRAVVARIKKGELAAARAMLRGLLAFPVKPSRDRDLARFARKCVERARRGVEALRDVEPTNVEGMHDLRIAYKELRYAAELLAEALPIDLRFMAEPAAKFQKRLGEVHDVDMAIATLGRARGLELPVRAAALERLAWARDKKTKKYLDEMAPTPELAAPPPASEPQATPSPPARRKARAAGPTTATPTARTAAKKSKKKQAAKKRPARKRTAR